MEELERKLNQLQEYFNTLPEHVEEVWTDNIEWVIVQTSMEEGPALDVELQEIYNKVAEIFGIPEEDLITMHVNDYQLLFHEKEGYSAYMRNNHPDFGKYKYDMYKDCNEERLRKQ